jgi:hypothetical protein
VISKRDTQLTITQLRPGFRRDNRYLFARTYPFTRTLTPEDSYSKIPSNSTEHPLTEKEGDESKGNKLTESQQSTYVGHEAMRKYLERDGIADYIEGERKRGEVEEKNNTKRSSKPLYSSGQGHKDKMGKNKKEKPFTYDLL